MKDGVPFVPIFPLNCFRNIVLVSKQEKTMSFHSPFELLSCSTESFVASKGMLLQLRQGDLLKKVVRVE